MLQNLRTLVGRAAPDNLTDGHSPPYDDVMLQNLRTLASRAAPDNLTGGHSPPYQFVTRHS